MGQVEPLGLQVRGRRKVKEKATHLTPAGWRAVEEVVGIGGHCAEVETADFQEFLLFGG